MELKFGNAHSPSFAQTCRILCLDCRHHLILPGTCSERGPVLRKRWKIIPSGLLSVLRMYYSWLGEDDLDCIPQHHTGTTIRCEIGVPAFSEEAHYTSSYPIAYSWQFLLQFLVPC